jgi:hypothetical protein
MTVASARDTKGGKRIPKIILLAMPEEKEGGLKTKVKRLDGMDENSERIGERNWRMQTRNRDEWKKPQRTARANEGQSSQ